MTKIKVKTVDVKNKTKLNVEGTWTLIYFHIFSFSVSLFVSFLLSLPLGNKGTA